MESENIGNQIEKILQRITVTRRFSLQEFYREIEKTFRTEGFREEAEGAMESILLLRTDAMGDNILTTPVLRELRRNRPEAYITLVTSPVAYPLMEPCPYVNEVYSFPLPKWKEKGVGILEELARFCRKYLWRRHYDLCICPCWGSRPLEERFLAYFSGARERVGYSDLVNNFYMPEDVEPEEERFLFTRSICNPPELLHDGERYLYLLEAMGMEIRERKTELWLSSADMRRAAERLSPLREEHRVIAMCVGAKDLNRKYPLEQWKEAMDEIRRFGWKFVILGGGQEAEDGNYLRDALPSGTVLNLAGRTSMRESVAVISLAAFYMGNVTGMMHAAAARGKPVISIYREAVDKEEICTGVLSEFHRFSPYLTNYIALRPEKALGKCGNILVYGGCVSPMAHCIAQVKPEEIVEAFRIMAGSLGLL